MRFDSNRQFLVVCSTLLLGLLLAPTVYLLQQRYYERGRAEPEAVQKGLSFLELLNPAAPEEGFDFSKLPPPAAEYTPDTLIVKFKEQGPSASADRIAAVAASATSQVDKAVVEGFEPLYPDARSPQVAVEENRRKFPQRAKRAPAGVKVPDLRTIYRLTVQDGVDIELLRASLVRDPQVEWVERETIKYPTQVPDDPLYNHQWWLPKIGLTPLDQESGWGVEKGKNEIRVATMDWCKVYDGSPPGFDTSHPDLKNLLPEGFNFQSEGICAGGHETLVTGIIAANTNNSLGVAGENWQVKILPVGSDFRKAIDWGADVVSVSWHPIDWWMFESARSLGILLVWSAGNRNEELPNRQECDYGLVVAATDQSDRKTSWSNWGDCVTLAAPGTSILTTTASSLGGWGLGTNEDLLALAVSPADLARAAYFDLERRQLLFLTSNGSNWSREAVDDLGHFAYYLSLQIDGADRPHLTFYDADTDRLQYAVKDAGQWQKEEVDASGKYGALKLDTAGNPLISYYQGGKLWLAQKTGGAWQKEVVDAGGDVGGWPSLAVSLDGTVGISYYDFANKALKFAKRGVGEASWTIETVDDEPDPAQIGYGSSLQFDGSGQPAIAYLKRAVVAGSSYSSDFLLFAVKTSSGWEKELVRGGESSSGTYSLYSFGRTPSLQFDKNGRPHLATFWGEYYYSVVGIVWSEGDLRILTPGTGGWVTASVVATGKSSYPGYQNEYILSSSGSEYVLYRIPGTGELKLGQEKLGEVTNPYANGSGTSFSAPIAAGAAALVAAQHPEYTVDEIRQALLAGVDGLGDSLIGAGRLNIRKTLAQGAPPASAVISGTVKLQARQNFAGVAVAVAGQEVLTDAAGRFEVDVVPGTYRVAANFPGYLETAAEVSVRSGENRDLGATELKGGDGNGDGRVDIFDLTAVGVSFGRQAAAVSLPGFVVDFNSDGLVNIFDLTVIGVNFASSAPRPW